MYYGQQFGGQAYLMGLGTTIMEYAKACGVFTKEQAYLMWPEKHYSTIDKALRGLVVHRNVFLQGERYYLVNPRATIDYDMIRCLWVLLDMKGDAKPNTKEFWLSRSVRPAYISYVKNSILYDIVPVNRGEDAILRAIDTQYQEEKSSSDENYHKYIIVVPNMDVLETLPIVNAPHIFAIVNDIPYEMMDYEAKKVVDVSYFED